MSLTGRALASLVGRSLVMASVAMASLFVAPLGAQHTVRGVVRDAILRGGPLAGAEVMVMNTSLLAVTDDAGRFTIAGVPAGQHLVMVRHEVFDTLGLAELEREVDVRADMALDFATPSLAEFQAERCGRALAPHEAIVLGYVTTEGDEAARGATVGAVWSERRVSAGSSEQTQGTSTASAGEDGAFALCGVPREPALSRDSGGVVTVRSPATLRATAMDAATDAATDVATGELTMLPIHAAVVRHDLVIGSEAEMATVTGRVVTEDGRPLGGARITRTGSSAVAATADQQGRFTLMLPRRSEQVIARSVGHQPVSVEFVPSDEAFDLGDVPLPPMAFALGRVDVTAARVTRERSEFDERRKHGLGMFLDDEEIKRLPKLTPQIVAARVQRADPIRNLDGTTTFAFKRISFTETRCVPPMFIDGVRMDPPFEPGQQDEILRTAVRVEVYTAHFAPPQFTDFNGCGALVVWTR